MGAPGRGLRSVRRRRGPREPRPGLARPRTQAEISYVFIPFRELSLESCDLSVEQSWRGWKKEERMKKSDQVHPETQQLMPARMRVWYVRQNEDSLG